MKKIILVPAFIFILAGVISAQEISVKAEITLRAENGGTSDEYFADIRMLTNVQSAVMVYSGGTLIASQPVSNMQASVPLSMLPLGTNVLNIEVWETIPIVEEMPGETNMKIEFSNKLLLMSAQKTAVKEIRMSAAGWLFLILGWGFILTLCLFSYSKIFGIKKEKIVETLEIDTHDE